MKLYYDSYHCILGEIYIVADESGIKNIELEEDKWQEFINNHNIDKDSDKCYEAVKQIDEYFLGKRKNFDLQLSITGTEFRKQVWNALLNIPYGNVISYSELAEVIGNPKAVRAVGQANRHNPLPIIIPCHRVIGKDKSLTGYAGKRTDIKEKLLKLEGVIL
jgi:methylated-DNA-[protein]-cysteine S-methyltransferase